MTKAVSNIELSSLRPWRQGKVRDIFALGELLLIVATDRISAFDVVLPTPIPGKGHILTQMSLEWFQLTQNLVANHLVSDEPGEFLDLSPEETEMLSGRSMVVKRAKPIPVECVVRGYLAGSGWRDYQETGAVCGIKLPSGMQEAEKLPEPLFTPATKAETGHDENISFKDAVRLAGKDTATFIRDKTLALYTTAAQYASERGILISDTKFEFGWVDEEIVLIDEILTPDSSRFWDAEGYEPGHPQKSFDKQFVRDYLESLAWDKKPPAPQLPPDVVAKTVARYQEAQRKLFGPD